MCPTIDGEQRWEESWREEKKKEKETRKKIQVCGKVGKSRNTALLFFQWFKAPEGRKVGYKYHYITTTTTTTTTTASTTTTTTIAITNS